MSSTVLDIYNRAISAVGGKGRLSSLTDNARTREECDIWYPLVRDQVQEGAYWPACRTTARLGLLATRDFSADWASGDPETQFKYRYTLPANCLRPWHLVDYQYFSYNYDDSRGELVLDTNAENAVLVYAVRNTNPGLWSATQVAATVFGLAAYIARPVTGQSGVEDRMFRSANDQLLIAQSDAANSQGFRLETTAPGHYFRGYEDSNQTRYFYPHGSLFGPAAPNA